MSFFDDAMKNAIPGGDLATPIAIAAGALLLHHYFGGSSTPTVPAAPVSPAPTPTGSTGGFLGGGDLLSGLSGLVGKLTSSGNAAQVNSWVGTGPNLPIQPHELGGALGQQALNDLAARSGLSQEELLKQLAVILPQVVNNLTPNGRLPNHAEIVQHG